MSTRLIISGCTIALSSASLHLWADDVPIPSPAPAQAPDSTQVQNQQVLENWQQTSGQQAAIIDNGTGAKLEFHGEVTTDIYNVDTSFDENNGALSGLQEGTFTNTRLQGDLRTTEPAGDVSYLQGVLLLPATVLGSRCILAKLTMCS